VAKLVPLDTRGDDIFGCLKGVVEIVGDIESPLASLLPRRELRG
jgi:hypothetical protein